MKSDLAKKLKEVLDNMSQEQFDQEWAKVTALNLEGPSFDVMLDYLSSNINTFGVYYIEENQYMQYATTNTETNYALAA